MHQIPSLPYKYSDLEPYIDEQTMRLHHTKHHQSYVDKLNAALETYPDLAAKEMGELLADLNAVPEAIRTAVQNQGGGHFNHTLFWTMLEPNKSGKESTARETTITLFDQHFGGVNGFKEKFTAAALGLFGSGWAWLVLDQAKKPAIITTPNQNAPLGHRAILLGVDVWEHAYYLKYQNRRAEYVGAFFHIINWDFVNQALTIALK